MYVPDLENPLSFVMKNVHWQLEPTDVASFLLYIYNSLVVSAR